MLTRFIKIQLVIFTILTVIALVVLGWYYLQLPSVAGIGQYELKADLPRSGGLYAHRQRDLSRHARSARSPRSTRPSAAPRRP